MKHLRLKNLQLIFFKRSFLIRCLFIFLFFCFVFLIWFFFVFDKFSNKLEHINQEIVILKNNKKLLTKLIKEKFKNIETAYNLKNKIESLYPHDFELNKILSIANITGLELINYSTENNNTIEKINNNLIPLSFKGNFNEILEFLTKILENKKILKIEKMHIIKFQDKLLKLDCIFNIINNYENI